MLDNLITERRPWLICEGVKGFLILISLHGAVLSHYCYRQRDDETVNVQEMMKDIHERWFEQEKEYMARTEIATCKISENND